MAITAGPTETRSVISGLVPGCPINKISLTVDANGVAAVVFDKKFDGENADVEVIAHAVMEAGGEPVQVTFDSVTTAGLNVVVAGITSSTPTIVFLVTGPY